MTTKPKPQLKIVPRTPLRAGGLEPTTDMQPGQYVCACESATDIITGRSRQAILQFRIIDGPHLGVGLRQWLTISEVGGIVSLATRYAKHCAIALGRDIEPGDALEPESIFPGKVFSVEVGYRLTEKMGGPANPMNAQRKKDARDFLRVHRIIELLEGL
jgi:hypothetical protein